MNPFGVIIFEPFLGRFPAPHRIQSPSNNPLVRYHMSIQVAKPIYPYENEPTRRAEPRRMKQGKFTGKTFVLTGGLDSLPREAAKERIRALGGDPAESVSRKTDYVVAGTDPGSKYEKAKKLSVKILSETEFLDMLQ